MLDYIGTDRNVILSIISLLLLLLPCYCANLARKTAVRRERLVWFGLVSLWIFSIFSFWGTDWFHLLLQYPEMEAGGQVSVEPFYVWVSQYFAVNYLGFRALVWGGGVVFLSLLLRKIPLPYEDLFYFFIIFCALCFSYSRQSVCTIVMLYGAFLFIDYLNHHKLKDLILSLLLIWASVYLHKSSPFLLVCLILSFLTINIRGKIVLLPFLLIPVAPDYVSELLSSYLQDEIVIDSQYLQNSLMVSVYYLEDDKEAVGVFGMFLMFVEYLVYYAVAILAVLMHGKRFYKKLPFVVKLFAKLQIIIVSVSSVFLFDLGATTDEMAHRFIMYSFLPSAVIVAYAFHNKCFVSVSKAAYVLAIINMIGNSVYPVYADLINHKF